MKKNIQLLLFLLITGFCLAGCGDDVEEITSDPVPVFDPDGTMKGTIHKFLEDPETYVNDQRAGLKLEGGVFNYQDSVAGFRELYLYEIKNDTIYYSSVARPVIVEYEDGTFGFLTYRNRIEKNDREVILYDFRGRAKDVYRRNKYYR
ncbi:MAG TPA: DUF4539 domain-containing protein [Candidatus Parabacteroides intestinipullorum]|uniref:DUF4539 domain-containing protein n=1 Tax=Candidatus Parabacteroides intestinipullorum TaxID=2838723 RepID=A0A9D2BFD4_9BACT|nr:DUF4539 domain-containing protein [Candidatus Parabacteroides intestinipullorum]